MQPRSIEAGRNLPDDCNVVIEVPMYAPAISTRSTTRAGALFVDRFMSTRCTTVQLRLRAAHACGDGEPLDVLVLAPVPW